MTKKLIDAFLMDNYMLTENSDEARELYDQSRYGTLEEGKLQLSLYEGLYLVEKSRIVIKNAKNKEIPKEKVIKRAHKEDKKFWTKYCVFRDIRNRGYIIKTALKFGADFRVYDRGVKPGEDHAKWVVFPVHESTTLTWHDFSAKNRVAHSTRKRLLVGVVDEESDVTYYEIKWIR